MIVIDCETGGLDPQKHALVSVALYCTKTREMLTVLVRPAEGLLLDPEAEEVHGFSREFLESNGLSERNAMERVAQWLEEREDDVGGANPRFDGDFLRAAAKRCGIWLKLPGRMVDVQTIAWVADKLGRIELPRKKPGGPASCSLDSILVTLGRAREGKRHDAAEDAALTAFAFQRLLTLVQLGGADV
jgi:DNA polymerase III epsilon subunit-like protein